MVNIEQTKSNKFVLTSAICALLCGIFWIAVYICKIAFPQYFTRFSYNPLVKYFAIVSIASYFLLAFYLFIRKDNKVVLLFLITAIIIALIIILNEKIYTGYSFNKSLKKYVIIRIIQLFLFDMSVLLFSLKSLTKKITIIKYLVLFLAISGFIINFAYIIIDKSSYIIETNRRKYFGSVQPNKYGDIAILIIDCMLMFSTILFYTIWKVSLYNADNENIILTNKYYDSIGNADKLKTYKELLDTGVITQEEFDEKKKQLLDI